MASRHSNTPSQIPPPKRRLKLKPKVVEPKGYLRVEWARKEGRKLTGARAAPKANLLRLLAGYSNDSWQCWPSQETLADDLRVSIRWIKRLLQGLRDDGLIVAEERHWRDGRQRVNRYTLAPGVQGNSSSPGSSQGNLRPPSQGNSRPPSGGTRGPAKNKSVRTSQMNTSKTSPKPPNVNLNDKSPTRARNTRRAHKAPYPASGNRAALRTQPYNGKPDMSQVKHKPAKEQVREGQGNSSSPGDMSTGLPDYIVKYRAEMKSGEWRNQNGN